MWTGNGKTQCSTHQSARPSERRIETGSGRARWHKTASTVDRFVHPPCHLMRIDLAILLLQRPTLLAAAQLNCRPGAEWGPTCLNCRPGAEWGPTSQTRVSPKVDLVKVKTTGSWRRPFLGVAGVWGEVEGLLSRTFATAHYSGEPRPAGVSRPAPLRSPYELGGRYERTRLTMSQCPRSRSR